MSTLPRRQFGLLVTVALAVVAAAVAGVVLFSSSRADEVDLTTAQLVPADAGIYVALNTDLDSSQWLTAFNLVERLGEEDPEGQLRDSVDDGVGLSWEDDVAPFLGGNAAFFLTSVDITMFDIRGGVIVKADDPEAALGVLEKQLGATFDERERRGTRYFADEWETTFVAILDGHLVATIDERSLFDVIAVYQGDAESLATVDGFQALRDELSRNFLAFLYLDSESMIADAFGDPVFETAMREAGVEIALEPMAAVIGADGDGFTFQGASISRAGVVSPLLEPRTPAFADVVPDDTAVFISANGVGAVLRDAIDAARDDIDAAAREGGYESLDDMLRSAGEEVGLESIDELFELFTGESALAVWFPTGDEDAAEGLVLTAVEDAARAAEIMDAIVLPGAQRSTVQAGGVEVTIVRGEEDDQEFAFALDGNTLLIGTPDGVTRVLEYSGPVLSTSGSYQGAVADLPTGLGSFAFFDLRTLLRLTEGGVIPELDRADEALRGAIINMVEERGVVRVSGVLTIEEQ